jgi:alkyl hydroperoxide reductase subunit AhpC
MSGRETEQNTKNGSSALGSGAVAPDFRLPNTPDQFVPLSELRGCPVILAFYPADWSPVLWRPDELVQRGAAGVPPF